MTGNQPNRFQAILTAKVAELSSSTRNRDGIIVERSADMLDELQAASERVLAVSHLDREFSQLRNAQAALRRIQEGTFGTCERCEEEIHPKRLAAVPWTPFCLHCQEAIDRNSAEADEPVHDFLRAA